MVVPNNHGFPTKNDHFAVFWGYYYFRKHPYIGEVVQVDTNQYLSFGLNQPITSMTILTILNWWCWSNLLKHGKSTLPRFNMEPKNDGFQKESPIPGCHFRVPC